MMICKRIYFSVSSFVVYYRFIQFHLNFKDLAKYSNIVSTTNYSSFAGQQVRKQDNNYKSDNKTKAQYNREAKAIIVRMRLNKKTMTMTMTIALTIKMMNQGPSKTFFLASLEYPYNIFAFFCSILWYQVVYMKYITKSIQTHRVKGLNKNSIFSFFFFFFFFFICLNKLNV